MNETERDRILTMVAEGALRPTEAAQLLASLAETPPTSAAPAAKGDARAASAEAPVEIQMRRPDGTYYTVQVPQNLVAIFWEVAKVHLKEQLRTVAKETAQGARNMVLNQTDEIRALLRRRMTGTSPAIQQTAPEEEDKAEARRRILVMVQEGRLNAADAGRLIEQVDSLAEFRKAHPQQPTP
jgi:hypothetical protein